MGPLGTTQWRKKYFEIAEILAHGQLEGVGDPECERAFAMNVTFCIHRALTPDEESRLPSDWEATPGGLAGGPLRVLWSRGIPHRPAAMPCESPGQKIIAPDRPDLWVPTDCGHCPPCVARAEIAAKCGV